MAAAGRLAGLEFAAADCAAAVGRLQDLRSGYAAIRKVAIPFALPPCATFDPLPPGTGLPQWTPKATIAIPTDTALPAGESGLAFASILELAGLLRQRLVSSVQLTTLALDRLARFDPRLHCVVTLLRDEALARAAALDAELAAGTDRGPLHGIPYGAKDLFAWPGAPTTFGAAPWRDHVWNATATPLQKLHDAGAGRPGDGRPLARRAHPQPLRPREGQQRFVGRFGECRGRWPGAVRARHRDARLDRLAVPPMRRRRVAADVRRGQPRWRDAVVVDDGQGRADRAQRP
jgi:hypothetical protein